MPIPTGTAAISFSQIRDELASGTNGVAFTPATTDLNLNTSTIRNWLFPATKLSGETMSLSEMRGVAFRGFILTGQPQTYNIRDAMVAAGWNGTARATANVAVTTGDLGTPAVANYALQTGTPWPAAATLVVRLDAGASIIGKGGSGGNGGIGNQNVPGAQGGGSQSGGLPGTGGGTAILASRALTIVNAGVISGGGGGGGGGAGDRGTSPPWAGGGGGGGGGRTGGGTTSAGGIGGTGTGGPPYTGGNGQPGTFSAIGLGGPGQGTAPSTRASGPGGNGGGRAVAGQSGTPAHRPGGAGGAAGSSISGYPLVTYSGAGSLLGPTI